MAVKVCDREPCDGFVKTILSSLRKTEEPEVFALEVVKKGAGRETERLELAYCPHCGTRIDTEMAEIIHRILQRGK